jgi:hypothetical protein
LEKAKASYLARIEFEKALEEEEKKERNLRDPQSQSGESEASSKATKGLISPIEYPETLPFVCSILFSTKPIVGLANCCDAGVHRCRASSITTRPRP